MKLILLILLLVTISFEGLTSPSSFVLQGQIIKPNGQALESSNVTFTLGVLSTDNECLLYEETSIINMTDSNGVFSVSLGTGVDTGNGGLPDLSTALDNSLNNQTGLTCATGTDYNPNGGDTRKLRISFNDGSGIITLPQDHVIESVPYAQYAGKLEGKAASDFIQVNSATAGVTQVALEGVFDNGANQSELLALLAGTSNNYSPISSSGAGSLPSFTNATPPTAPVAGDVWFNTDSNQVLYYDGSSTQPLSGGGTGTVTNIATGSGLTGGPITTTGTISVANGGISNAHLSTGIDASKVTVGTLPLGVVPSGTDSSKLPLAGGTLSGDLTLGGNQILGVGHLTQANQSTITLGAYTNGEEATLVGSLAGANAGATWFNSDSGEIKYWDGSSTLILNNSNASVTSVTASAPLASSGGATPDISINLGNGVYNNAGNLDIDLDTDPGLEFNANKLRVKAGTGLTRTAAGINADIGTGAGQLIAIDDIPTCAAGQKIQMSAGPIYTMSCVADVDTTLSGAAAGGDLSGTYPNPSIASNAVTTAKILDGNVTGAKLENSGVSAGTYPKVTVDAKGRVTAGTTLVAGDIPNLESLSGTTDITIIADDDSNGSGDIDFIIDATTAMSIENNGDLLVDGSTLVVDASTNRVGLGVLSPSYLLSLDGQTNQTIGQERNSTGDTAGNSLTLEASGATLAATDKDGGTLSLSSGIATGTGSSQIEFKTATPQGGTNTTDNIPSTKMTILGDGKVGIGKTPLTELDVNGTVTATNFAGDGSNLINIQAGTADAGASTGNYIINTDSDNAGSDGGVAIQTNGSTVATITEGGNIQSTAGLVATPGLSFTTDTDTGIYNSAADTLSVATGGVEGLRVNTVASGVNYVELTPAATGDGPIIAAGGSDANIDLNITPKGTGNTLFTTGNVGIGTSTPVAKLDISMSSFVMETLRLYNGLGSPSILLVDSTPGDEVTLRKNNHSLRIESASNSGGFSMTSDGSHSFSAGPFNVRGRETPRAFQINNGIGQNAGNPTYSFYNDNDTGLYSPAADELALTNGANESLRIDSSGNVGIGTSSPIHLLQLAGDSRPYLHVGTEGDDSSDEAGIMLVTQNGDSVSLGNGTARGWEIYGKSAANAQANDLSFTYWDGSTWQERIVVDSLTGNLGIGTTAPARLLQVEGPMRLTAAALPGSPGTGDIAIDSGDSNKLKYYNGSSWVDPADVGGADDLGDHTATTNIQLNDNWLSNDGGAEGIRILDDGKVGIGTAAPNQALHVEGRINATSGFKVNNDFPSVAYWGGSANLPGVEFDSNDGYRYNQSSNAFEMVIGGDVIMYLSGVSRGIMHLNAFSDTPSDNAHLILKRSRGTEGSPTYVNTNDELGDLSFRNHTNGEGAGVYSLATETHSATVAGSNLIFKTIPNSTQTPVDRMLIDQNGYVGIGTTSPAEQLDVHGNTASDVINVRNTSAVGYSSINFEEDDGTERIAVGFGNSSSAISQLNNRGFLWLGTGVDFTIANHTTTEYFYIEGSNGYVGIGTTSPARILQVEGPMRLTAAALPGSPGTGDIAIDSGDSNKLKYYNGSSWVDPAGAGGADDLGDHTATTDVDLSNFSLLNLEDGDAATPSISFNSDSNTGIFSSSADNLSFSTAGNERFNIDATGNILATTDAFEISGDIADVYNSGGSGTQTPGGVVLEVKNDNQLDGTFSGYILESRNTGGVYQKAYLGNISSNTGSQGTLVFGRRSGVNYIESARIDQAGDLGIGTLDPARRLHVEGQMRLSPLPLPGSPGAGDVAIDSGDSNKLKYYNGSSWVNPAAADDLGDHTATATLNLSDNLISNLNAGTAGAPSLSFNGDADTGLFSSGADSISLATAGSEAVSIDSTGDFGIGTSDPKGKLHVFDSDTQSKFVLESHSSLNTAHSPSMILRRSRLTGVTPQAVNDGDRLGLIGVQGYGATEYGSNNNAIIEFYAEENFTDTERGTSIRFETTPEGSNTRAEALRIASSGNIGIGTEAPSSKLHVEASSGVLGKFVASSGSAAGVYIDGADGGHQAHLKFLEDGTSKWELGKQGDDSFYMWDNANSRDFLRVNLSGDLLLAPVAGNVGVGTLTPTTALDVNGLIRSSSGGFRFPDGTTMTTAAATATGDTSTTDLNYAADSDTNGSGEIIFSTNGTERLRITNGGAYHIAGNERILANGRFRAAGADNLSSLSYGYSGDGNTGLYHASSENIGLATNGTEHFRVTSSGDVGVGKTNPDSKFHVDSATSGICVSDDGSCDSLPGGGEISAKTTLNTGADYAEYFEAEENLLEGDLVGLNLKTGLVRGYRPNDPLIGVVSTDPGVIGNSTLANKEGTVLVALVGQVPFNKKQVVEKEGIILTLDQKPLGYLLASGKVYINLNTNLVEGTPDRGIAAVEAKKDQEIEQLKKENEDIKKRLEKLEKLLSN